MQLAMNETAERRSRLANDFANFVGHATSAIAKCAPERLERVEDIVADWLCDVGEIVMPDDPARR